jgi:multicomponent Na+:H+ antiporter subunit C
MVLMHYFNYLAVLFFFVFGIYVMLAARNLLKKVIGMGLMQVGVILFFISLAYKNTAQAPILAGNAYQSLSSPESFINPLPHALMLTAIVVGVSLLGVSLVLIISVYEDYHTMEEDEIISQIKGQEQ